jgi:integrase
VVADSSPGWPFDPVETGIWRYRGTRRRTLFIGYHDAGGRWHFVSTRQENLQVARKMLAQARSQALAGITSPPPRHRKTTLADFAGPPKPNEASDQGGPYWRDHLSESSRRIKESTKRDYRKMLRVHLLPRFGNTPLVRITRAAAKAFIAGMINQQRHSYSQRNPNPARPTYARKTLVKIGSLLSTLLQAASEDYELIARNDLSGIKWAKVCAQARPRKPIRILQPDDFRRSLEALGRHPEILKMALATAFGGGPNWEEAKAIQMGEVDFRRHEVTIHGTKTASRDRIVRMSPVVEAVYRTVPWREGYAFSEDGGRSPLSSGTWIRRQWTAAQRRAGVVQPIDWHGLRHMFVSLNVAAGKPIPWVSQQAGHKNPAVTLGTYHHLFERMPVTPAEWAEDLVWPGGWRSSPVLRAVLETADASAQKSLKNSVSRD